jgi:hypothetical protein
MGVTGCFPVSVLACTLANVADFDGAGVPSGTSGTERASGHMDLGHPRTFLQGGFGALLMILVLCISSTVARAAGPTILFNIPAGDAQKTLQQYYAQSRIEMLYLTDMVRGTKTNPVSGNLDASTALAEMLKGHRPRVFVRGGLLVRFDPPAREGADGIGGGDG